MKKVIKNIIYSILGLFPTKGVVVLMYHSIGDGDLFFTVKREEFERQMQYLKEEEFNVVSLRKLEEYLENRSIPPKTVVITFDDGYKDNFLNAYPVLKKYNLPATIFVATGEVGKSKNLRGCEFEMLSESDIKELDNLGLISIEPHTVNHLKLAKLSEEEVDYQIGESKKALESILEKTCQYFAYPCGSYNDTVLSVARKFGFKLGFTVEKGKVKVSTDKLLMPRNSIDSQVNFDEFKNIIRFGRI